MADKLKLEVILSAVDKLTRPMAAARGESRQLASSIKDTQAQIKRLTETNAAMQARMARGEVPTRAMARAMAQTDTEVLQLNNSLRTQQQRLESLNRVQQRNAALQATSARIAQTRNSLAMAGVGGVAAGAAVLGSTAAPIAAFAQAEDAATGLKNALMNARGELPETYQDINKLATSLGDRLPGSTADFQNMMTMLIRQGMSAKSILGGLGEATAFLAVQLKMPTDMAAEFAAKMQDATRTSEQDMMGLMDVIQRGFYLGVDENNMLNAFSKLSPALDVLKKQGLEGAQALAPLVVMADQMGMKGEASGNALRKVLQLSLDADKVKKASSIAGVKLDFTNGAGEFGGLDQLFSQLDQLKGLSTQTRISVLKTIFGDDAETLSIVSMMIDKGAAGYAEVQGKMAAQADLQQRVNQQLGTLKNTWDAATGTFTNALAEFGAAIAPDLKAVIEWVGSLTARMREWTAANPTLAKWLMRTVIVVGLLLAGLGGLAMIAAAILTPFAMMGSAVTAISSASAIAGGALGVLRTVIFAVGRALMMNPIGLAITAIALAAYLIYRYWEPIKAFFLGIWAQITTAFNGGIAGISALLINWSPLGLLYSGIQKLLGFFGIEMPAKFTEFGAQMLQGLANGITNRLTAVKETITGAGDAVVGWFKERLGIHSPSRVFAQLGGYTMAGLDQGLQAGQAGPLATVMAFGKQVVAAGATAVGVLGAGAAGAQPLTQPGTAGTSAAGSSATHYEIHVHAAPGMDEEALARKVLALIQTHERNQAARSRARLSDSE